MKPLVQWLKVKKATKSDLTLNGKMNNRVTITHDTTPLLHLNFWNILVSCFHNSDFVFQNLFIIKKLQYKIK